MTMKIPCSSKRLPQSTTQKAMRAGLSQGSKGPLSGSEGCTGATPSQKLTACAYPLLS